MNSSIKHVAIIMDGNGRWAKMRQRPRVWGHVKGSNNVTEIVKESAKMGLESLTLYAFSTENWSRPQDEVTNLFKLLKKFLIKERKNLIKNNIRFNVIGNYKVLDSKIVQEIETSKKLTANNTGLSLSLAINYGGRAEIIDAVNDFLKDNRAQREVTEEDINKYLYNPELKNIDLLIRTAGDQRVSNFLLWQISYAEMYFTDTKWPDFTTQEFREIIASTEARERRFGGIENTNTLEKNKYLADQNLKILS
jgi:undecaprenyl diphosphate synthase